MSALPRVPPIFWVLITLALVLIFGYDSVCDDEKRRVHSWGHGVIGSIPQAFLQSGHASDICKIKTCVNNLSSCTTFGSFKVSYANGMPTHNVHKQKNYSSYCRILKGKSAIGNRNICANPKNTK